MKSLHSIGWASTSFTFRYSETKSACTRNLAGRPFVIFFERKDLLTLQQHHDAIFRDFAPRLIHVLEDVAAADAIDSTFMHEFDNLSQLYAVIREVGCG